MVLVVCQPDRPRGRGKKVEPPPVKAAALERGLEVLQPVKLRDGELAARMRDAALDLAIVVAYGRILPPEVFEAPVHGTWNVHASLLPRHRGASPIQHAILAGDARTGVTLMQLSAGLDEGPMLLRRELALDGSETGGSLTAALATLGGSALVEGLQIAKASGLLRERQDPARATYAPLIEKAAGELRFDRPAVELARRVRAFDPWPGTFVPDPAAGTSRDAQPLRVLSARAISALAARAGNPTAPGRIAAAGETLQVETLDGVLEILSVQPAGKKPMSAADYLRGAGRHLAPGATLRSSP